MTLAIVLYGTIFLLTMCGESESSSAGTMEFLEQIKQNYSKEIRPFHGGDALKVRCSMYVSTLGSVDTTNMDYSVTFYLRKTWQDPRLQFDPAAGVLIFQSEAARHIWIPAISFPDEKQGKLHDLIDENQIIQIWPNGTVVRTLRLTMTLICHMKPGKFPMDGHKCSLMFESLAYPINEVELEWEDNNMTMGKDMSVSKFQIDPNPITRPCASSSFHFDSFSCLEVVFKLHRSLTHFLLQVYLTSILVVLLSWISFWINPRSEPARVTLGMTSVLTLSTEISGVQQQVPDFNFATAIDVWLAMCMIFVFAVLVEFAIVSYGYTKLSKRQRRQHSSNHTKQDNGNIEFEMVDPTERDVEVGVAMDVEYQSSQSRESNTGVKFFSRVKRFFTISEPGDLDHICRVIFPIAFGSFCIVYWFSYIV